jgi:uncharacterized protein YhfF
MADLDSFSFGDTPALADELLELVLVGKRTATCWAAGEGVKGVEVGKRWIVKDGEDRPRAIVETVELTRRRFEDVDSSFARDEGEGDRSLEYWRLAHTEYFTRQGAFSQSMDLYCERLTTSGGSMKQMRLDARSRCPRSLDRPQIASTFALSDRLSLWAKVRCGALSPLFSCSSFA